MSQLSTSGGQRPKGGQSKVISLQIKKRYDLKCYCWTSLAVQWLRLQAPVEGGWEGRFDPWGTKFAHAAQPKTNETLLLVQCPNKQYPQPTQLDK